MMEEPCKSSQGKFEADEFVKFLLKEGASVPCDETLEAFHQNFLPDYYDEGLFKRGQKFFHDNIFIMLFTKLLGLLSNLSMPSIAIFLMHTKMSSSNFTAYKRYLATVMHMCIWYESDFTPGSRLWQSLLEVKNKHKFASKKCTKDGLNGINQRDMALTQFGFMGYFLVLREEIGLLDAKDEDLEGLIHIWRVIGSVMGLEDRFNICRPSLEETTNICKSIVNNYIRPSMDKKDANFITMCTYLMNGMWSMNPTFNARVYLVYLYDSINPKRIRPYFELNYCEKITLFIIYTAVWLTRFDLMRHFLNFTQSGSLWLMKVCPFLAYYQFGFGNNSHVNILPKNCEQSNTVCL